MKTPKMKNGNKIKTTKNNHVNKGSAVHLYNILRYHVVPPCFVLFFTLAVQYLTHLGNPSAPFQWDMVLGNAYSWKVVGIFMAWAFIFLHTPAKTYKGPPTSFGYVPLYSDNGFSYYIITTATYIGLHYFYPDLSVDIYKNMPYIFGTLNTFAFGLCSVMLVMGKFWPQSGEKMESAPFMYEFYRGMEIHPRLFGVDIKQWTNCRVGMMSWQVLIVAYVMAAARISGDFNTGHIVNVLLQTIYIAKFFWWETGYFTTLDITLDRAGYYICWGCLVWVPSFYTYSSYYLVAHPSSLDFYTAAIVGFLGLASVAMNYRVDYEKQLFRMTKGRCQLYGKPVRSMVAIDQNTKKPSNLLLSGCWGLARHLNYTFEIIAAFLWCSPGWGQGICPFLYAIFLTILLLHRIFRDEDKCSKKYGRSWDDYCKLVPYRMIPYVF